MLQRLSEEDLQEILSRALQQWRQDEPLPLTEEQKKEEKEALSVLAVYSDGDGKSSLIEKQHDHLLSTRTCFSTQCNQYSGSCFECLAFKGITLKS